MLKVYLAAPYSKKDELNTYAIELRSLGIIVTSRWLDETHNANIQLHEVSHADTQKYALQDWDDILNANAVVFFTDPTKTIVRAGRHVEFGMALAWHIPIFVVGPELENIFHYLPQVKHFESWYRVRDMLYALYVTNAV